MRQNRLRSLPTAVLISMCLMCVSAAGGEQRFQIEVIGGISYLNPKDLNLLSRAEEQYNDLYFVQRLRYFSGYFVNDFPEMRWVLPAGLCIRYGLTPRFSISLGVEGFKDNQKRSIEGSFGYSSESSQQHTRKYDPCRMRIWGFSVTAGIHYCLPLTSAADLELGGAVGWAKARFEFASTWSYAVDYTASTNQFSGRDGGTLEGNGTGNGPTAQVMIRLSRRLGQRIGLFVESAAVYSRMKSIEGTGRETRLGIPREETWEGVWGIKRENIQLSWASAEIYIPTNFWEGWTADQRARDFVLDLSRIRLSIGLFIRF